MNLNELIKEQLDKSLTEEKLQPIIEKKSR